MNDEQLLRYSRHILLPEIDIAGQEAIVQGRVLIVGLGGLGSPVAMYLAAAGVGTMTLVDDDEVDVSNLQRQILHKQSHVGQLKTASADSAIYALNPSAKVRVFSRRLDDAELSNVVSNNDVVVDCSDNFATRSQLNRVCLAQKVPLVSGAAIRFEGQLTVFDFRDESSPCYHCLYGEPQSEQANCAQSGVFAPIVGVVGSMQAMEALKLLAGMESSLRNSLALFDGKKNRWRYIETHRDATCSVCSR